ncbi:MAG: CAP domain-containing protein [Chloroflexia bacterium]
MQASNNYTHPDNCIAQPKEGSKRAAWRSLVPSVLCVLTLVSAVAQGAFAQRHTAEVLSGSGAPTSSQYFSVTGKLVAGSFLQTFNRFGLRTIGYPLSEARQERGLTVQYFERVRMEYHPELASKGFPVLMSRLGDDFSKPSQPFARVGAFGSSKARAYLPVTGHSLSEPFLSFWKKTGGVELYGYPLSEPMRVGGMLVQWFERARFEYHPELAKKGQAVQLSLLGRDALQRAGGLTSAPAAPPPPAPPAPVAQQGPQVALSGMESSLLRRINEVRAAAGLQQVHFDAAVTAVARARSNDMAERNYFSHTTPEGTNFLSMLSGRSIQFKFGGEILARNNYPDDQASNVAMDSYLNSAPHKAIIMDGRYSAVGLGYAKSGEDAMHYFTVIFVEQ